VSTIFKKISPKTFGPHCVLTVQKPHNAKVKLYVGESNENFKYFLSHKLLNTKGTQ